MEHRRHAPNEVVGVAAPRKSFGGRELQRAAKPKIIGRERATAPGAAHRSRTVIAPVPVGRTPPRSALWNPQPRGAHLTAPERRSPDGAIRTPDGLLRGCPGPAERAGGSRGRVFSAAVLAAVLLLGSACSSPERRSESVAASCDTSRGTLVVGVIAPMTGDLSALGLGIRNSADLAVDQANQLCAVPGYRLRLQVEDDQAVPDVAAQAATRLAADAEVIGVIGTLNSSTSLRVQPILHERGIVQISPASTNPTLTLGDNPATAPARPYDSYFRVATTDLVQGPFGARYLVGTLGKRAVAVIDDGKTYGAGLAADFAEEARRTGATVVTREKVGENDTDFSAVIERIRPLGPDAVYYGGEYAAAGPLSAQLAAAGLDIPLMGGEAICNVEYISRGGRPGDLCTGLGAPVGDLPSAAGFVRAYDEANYAEGFETYGALTYDAVNVLIRSAVAALSDGEPWSADKRAAVIAGVQATDVDGATGQLRFDRFGDTTNKVLTVYQIDRETFVARLTGS